MTSGADVRERAREERRRRALARKSYYDYARYVYRGWIDAAHHRLLAEYLEQVERYVATGGREGIGRLLIFMPPRHGKSLNASVLFPTWFLGRNPDKRVILASYNSSLAMGFSRQARNVMQENRYRAVFGDRSGQADEVRIADDSRSVEAWDLHDHKGGMVAAGVGGGITGKGADLMIVDDPHKDRADVESDTRRESVWKWWTSTAYTRLEDGAAVIGMLTRWHGDDWAGRLIKAMVEEPEEGESLADQWTILCLPAIAEDWAENVEREQVIEAAKSGWFMGVDPMGRKPGQALWPEKYDEAALAKIHGNTGGYDWDALYQQRPRRIEGALIKANQIEVVDRLPDGITMVRYWDLAVSPSDRADYIVGAKGGRLDGRLYLADIRRIRGPWADARPKMKRVMLADGPGVEQGIEVAGQQGGYFQELQRDDELSHVTLRAVNPKVLGSKTVRANLWSSRIEDGLVLMLRAGWNDAFVAECLAFPRGTHDDQVDGVSGINQMMPWTMSMADVPQAASVPSAWDPFGEMEKLSSSELGRLQGVSGGSRWQI